MAKQLLCEGLLLVHEVEVIYISKVLLYIFYRIRDKDLGPCIRRTVNTEPIYTEEATVLKNQKALNNGCQQHIQLKDSTGLCAVFSFLIGLSIG